MTEADYYHLPYNGHHLSQFRNRYIYIHGYLSLLVCIFGLFTNILNIIVLTRKKIISPINTILTGLSVTDMLAVLFYIPFTIYHYIQVDVKAKDKNTYSWAMYFLFLFNVDIVIHTICISLTIVLAVWKFICITSKNCLNMSPATFSVIGIYVTIPILCIPVYMIYTVDEFKLDGKLQYFIFFSDFGHNNRFMEDFTFWMFKIVIIILPCITLTCLSVKLFLVLYKGNHHIQHLRNDSGNNTNAHLRNDSGNNTNVHMTRMILAVLLLFLITEFPAGILALLSRIIGKEFFDYVNLNLTEVFDILVLSNNAYKFILYFSLNPQFRDTFIHLFLLRPVSKWKSLQDDEPNHGSATTSV